REQQAADKKDRESYTKLINNAATEQTALAQKYTNSETLLNEHIAAELNQEAAGNAGKLALDAKYFEQYAALAAGAIGNGATSTGTGGGSGVGLGFASSSLDIPSASNSASNSSSVSTNNTKNSSFTLVQNITGGRDEKRLAQIAASEARKIFIEGVGS
ncbi:MAG: hypothetical protein H0X30_32545, partial [Anaerolineae bacterium]|nr:hypothetical protein [Anaerolineae bacterium]